MFYQAVSSSHRSAGKGDFPAPNGAVTAILSSLLLWGELMQL